MKSHQLEAAFVRRREQEQMRVERTSALNRYYDHWGKVTTRFENWTTPEYYQQAEDKLKQAKDKKEKDLKLEERRSKLRALHGSEKTLYEKEMMERKRPWSAGGRQQVGNATLEKIHQQAKERENIKRKLELDAKLYGRWRHGVDDQNLIFDAKSDNQVMARLNWLDMQVEDQMKREEQEAISQERHLRMQEEFNKSELVHMERQQLREKEIREIRALQERHMDQLKERHHDSDLLKEQETQLRSHLDDLEKELELLQETSAVVHKPAELPQAHNMNNIKVFIRKRSDFFRNEIRLIIQMLERVREYTTASLAQLSTLLAKYNSEYEAETGMLSQIEGMYESEAKHCLVRFEDQWQAQHLERQKAVQQLLHEEQAALTTRLNDNVQRQQDLIELRSTHLASIENSNEKLKQLIQEQEDSPRPHIYVDGSMAAAGGADRTVPFEQPAMASLSRSGSPRRISTSFSHLNLDVADDALPPSHRNSRNETVGQQEKREDQEADNSTQLKHPRYGRKLIAWN